MSYWVWVLRAELYSTGFWVFDLRAGKLALLIIMVRFEILFGSVDSVIL